MRPTPAEPVAGRLSDDDWFALPAFYRARFDGLADRVLALLLQLRGSYLGREVDRLEHCLQSATRAMRAGRDDDYVAGALLHDVGDVLCPAEHASFAATLLAPYVSEDVRWMVANHQRFQAHHAAARTGASPDARDELLGHEHFDLTVEFCAEFDWPAFDPTYVSLPLEDFGPLLARVFARPRRVDLELAATT